MADPALSPGVSEQELDLTVVEAEDRRLVVTLTFREIGEDGILGDFVKSEKTRFAIRGSLPVPLLTAFLRIETRINEALAADDDRDTERDLAEAMGEAHRRIIGLIVERTPSAFRPRDLEIDAESGGHGETVRVKPAIELDVSQILVLLSWIAGDTSVADAVARSLTAGRSPAKTAEDLEVPADGVDHAHVDEGQAGPFVSSTP